MSYQASSTKYLEAEILSRPKEQLVPLLYEHLLAGLHRAGVQIEQHDIVGKSASLEKANAIVLELASTLDHDQGEIAQNLSSLYAYFSGEILAVSRSLDRDRLSRLIGMVSELHDAWRQAADSVAPRTRAGAAELV